ncbi:hypothetical protein V9T40_010563 [Parthenolecanium corni]|uniref:Uncharacterized protein n=1 Tax=Parthenolecanium corni TaxID=536013 RepID=A0AAN9XXM0_9HEMI
MTSWSAQQKKVENLDFENSQLECAHDDEIECYPRYQQGFIPAVAASLAQRSSLSSVERLRKSESPSLPSPRPPYRPLGHQVPLIAATRDHVRPCGGVRSTIEATRRCDSATRRFAFVGDATPPSGRGSALRLRLRPRPASAYAGVTPAGRLLLPRGPMPPVASQPFPYSAFCSSPSPDPPPPPSPPPPPPSSPLPFCSHSRRLHHQMTLPAAAAAAATPANRRSIALSPLSSPLPPTPTPPHPPPDSTVDSFVSPFLLSSCVLFFHPYPWIGCLGLGVPRLRLRLRLPVPRSVHPLSMRVSVILSVA